MDRATPLAQQFADYDREHPHIYRAFACLALRQIATGRTHGGAKRIMEELRFDTAVRATGRDFKVDNRFTAFYARKFERDFPEHAGFFRLRKSVACFDR